MTILLQSGFSLVLAAKLFVFKTQTPPLLSGPAEVAVHARLGKATPVWDFQLQSGLTLQGVDVCILTKLTSLHWVLSAVMDLPGALFNSAHCVHR